MRAEGQIQNLIAFLFSPVGLLAMSAFLCLLVSITVSKSVKWGALIGMLYVSTLGTFEGEMIEHTLVFPLEQIRSQSQAVVGALLIALLIPTLMAPRGWRRRLVPLPVVLYLVFELTFAARQGMGGLMTRGLVGAVLFLLFFLVAGIGVTRWLQTLEDVEALIRSLAVTGLVFVAGVCYQWALNPGAILLHRFLGTTANPQFAGAFIALTLPPTLYILLRREEPKPLRIALACNVGLMVVFLAWTGSRTGLLMTLVGLGAMFRTRIKKILGVTIVCGIIVIVASQFFSESTRNLERLTSTQDTRSHRWMSLIKDFKSAPLYGQISEQPRIMENTYLSTAARMGMVGVTIMVTFMGATFAQVLKLQRYRHDLGEHALMADMVTAGLVSIFVGSVFEGFLLGIVVYWVPFMYICLSVMAFLLDSVEVYGRS